MRTPQPPAPTAPRIRAARSVLLPALGGAACVWAFLVGDACFPNPSRPPTTMALVAWQPEPASPDRPPPDASAVQEAVVVMADGSRYTGLLVRQSDEEVVLEIGGIEMPLRRRDISRVDVLAPVLERYARMRAAIPDDDIPALLRLAEWLVSRREFEAAAKEVLEIRRLEPGNPRALELERLIEAERALVESAPDAPPAEPGEAALPEGGAGSADEVVVLSPEEVNLIRVYELDLTRLPRVVIPRSTVERLLEEYAGDPLIPMTQEGRDDLFRAARSNPRRILEIIFRLRARHLYGQVQVIDNPRSMQMFRDRVHRTWLINACAKCHNTGPDAPPGPRLITRRPNSDATVYSNFLILDRYRMADGTALINYDEPSDSPLLQMGLPRALVQWSHPDTAEARGWSPVFLGTSTTAHQNAIAWIKSMYQPRPEYPIEYPPVREGAAAPAAPAPPVER